MNKDNLPEPIKEAIENFFVTCHEGQDLNRDLDNTTQYDLNFIDTQPGGGRTSDYFFLMRNLKDLLAALKPYAE